MKNQAGNSRFDAVLKMLLIAFVALLAFSSGVYFGREMTESDYQRKALESDYTDTHYKTAEKSKDFDVHEEEALTTDDVESLSDKYVNAERDNMADVVAETKKGSHKPNNHDGHDEHGNGHKAAAKAAHANDHHHDDDHEAPKPVARTKKGEGQRNVASANDVKPIVKQPKAHDDGATELAHPVKSAKPAKPDLSAAHEAARRVAHNDTPSIAQKVMEENRAPSSLPKSVGAVMDTEFTVQVASYPSLDEAKNHANDLVKKGFPAYPVEATVKGKSWYRVSVGSFKSQKEAHQYRSQLMKQANLNSAIVQKIQR